VKLSWQHVAVIGLILGAVVTLAALGQDTTALLGLGTLLLAGIGLIAGQQQSIRDNTNGTMGTLLTMVEAMAGRMAEMTPADQITSLVEQTAQRIASNTPAAAAAESAEPEQHEGPHTLAGGGPSTGLTAPER
jgi:hypothetical protein